jgi:ParB family chromosome partitioning protein
MNRLDEFRKANGNQVRYALKVGEIPADGIQRYNDQPRQEFDDASLARLADSLKTRGQLPLIRVRWGEGRGAYVIIGGERRWRAAVQEGLATLACSRECTAGVPLADRAG